ncbi:ribosomal large subunit pseudouridine synthase C [endosymbiont of Euscepes postfasciatus]|uniref:RluA family pseudouridine synthase n=1 Tax=endosymbiont of Euscepes postfasciatus TaxID=650377 RepID=UPI000DC70A9E|nr:RluA family pseudouridine synthase [endosymbiont of Euscepes postfasciatus]BBA84637.1 ribosomal large subunit pseudouridine synthase C [endosymbiont of Euscepes postfasciatus]
MKFFNIKYIDLNRRIDNWFFSNYKNVPKSLIYKIIRKGYVKINNSIVKPDYKLQINDKLDIIYNLFNKKKYSYIKYNDKEFIKNKILYEDKYLLIINKPHGISVHNGLSNTFNIISYIKSVYNNNYNLVHRLDKNSSGILIISKNLSILKKINFLFNENSIFKKYIALVYGAWNIKNNIIRLPIHTFIDKISKKKKSIISNHLGKKSITKINVIKYFKDMTLIEAIPITGRTHQIRIHTSFIGNPIVMDNIYGNKNYNKIVLKYGLKRMFLHSTYIKFIHPIYNKVIEINSPLDNKLSDFIKKISQL